jgi:hypothetical protein
MIETRDLNTMNDYDIQGNLNELITNWIRRAESIEDTPDNTDKELVAIQSCIIDLQYVTLKYIENEITKND